MPRRIISRDVPDESDEEENWFGNADPKPAEKSSYTGNMAIPLDIDPTLQFDFGPTPEQAIENVRSLPTSVHHGKVWQAEPHYNITFIHWV